MRNQVHSLRFGLNNQVVVFEKLKFSKVATIQSISIKSSQKLILIPEMALLTALYRISKLLTEF